MADRDVPKRQLGFAVALALVVGNIIGSGIFLLPANLAPYGLNAIIGWGVTIAGALCLAAVFAALARALPEASGPYDYVLTGLGELPAFLVMWGYWMSVWVGIPAIAIAAVSYLSSLAPNLLVGAAAPAAAVGLVILFTAVACSGARTSGAVQVVTSVLKLVPLVAAIVVAVLVFGSGNGPDTSSFAATPVSMGGISGAMALTLWALLGFECATVPASRVRDPGRTIPRATILGTLIAGLVYVGASSAVFLLLPAELAAKSSAPFADLISRYWGPSAGTGVVLFAAISCLGALNGWVLMQGEVPLTLARRGVFPKWFGVVNAKGMPVRAQVLGTALSSALIAANYTRGLTDLFGFVILLATSSTLVLYLVVALSALRLMAKGELGKGVLLLIAALGVAYAIWTLYGAGREALGWGAVLFVTAIPVYHLMRSRSGSSPAAGVSPAALRE